MIGERGGGTATVEQGVDLVTRFKGDLAAAVRADILDYLEHHREWHRDDLRVQLAAQDKNVLGAVVIGLINQKRIVETGERRRSADPAAHGRKSSVYQLSGFPAMGGKDRTSGPVLTGGSDGSVMAGGSPIETRTSGVRPAVSQLFDMPPDKGGRAHWKGEE